MNYCCNISIMQRSLLLLLNLLGLCRANIIISPNIPAYTFYENVTDHIYCQSSFLNNDLTIQRPEGQGLTTTGVVEVLKENLLVVIKFDRIRASDAGNYLCKGDDLVASFDLLLQQIEIVSDNPFNLAMTVTRQFITEYDLRYPNITSFQLPEGSLHTFHCPSTIEYPNVQEDIVVTRWFLNGLSVRNDSYVTAFPDGRLQVQLNPIEGEYVCEGFLPLAGYPRVVLMRANLTVLSPSTSPPPVPTVLPVYAIAVIPVGIFVLILLSSGCLTVSILLMVCCYKRVRSRASRPQYTHFIKSPSLFKRSLEVNYKKLHFDQKISEGTFGRFYSGRLEDEKVVIKRFEGEWGDRAMEVERDVMLRIENIKLVYTNIGKSNFFVNLIAIVTKRPPYCLVYEEMNGGNLGNFLSQLKRGPVPQWYIGLLTNLWADKYAPRVSDDLMSVCTQVSQSMLFLQQKRTLHRSLSPSKVLLQGYPKGFLIKITGFSPEGEQVGTDQEKLYYRAPEVINGSPHSAMSEVYSLSLLLLNVLTLASTAEMGGNLSQAKRLKPVQPPNVSDKLFAIFKDGLDQTAEERPSLQLMCSELEKLSSQNPASSLLRLRLPEEIVPVKQTWHQWDQAILLAKPPILRSTDPSREGFLIDNKLTESEKKVTRDSLFAPKKDASMRPRPLSSSPQIPDVPGTESNVSLRILRRDKKNIPGLV